MEPLVGAQLLLLSQTQTPLQSTHFGVNLEWYSLIILKTNFRPLHFATATEDAKGEVPRRAGSPEATLRPFGGWGCNSKEEKMFYWMLHEQFLHGMNPLKPTCRTQTSEHRILGSWQLHHRLVWAGSYH